MLMGVCILAGVVPSVIYYGMGIATGLGIVPAMAGTEVFTRIKFRAKPTAITPSFTSLCYPGMQALIKK